MTKFTDLGLSQPVLQALDMKGYDTPTPIQAPTDTVSTRSICSVTTFRPLGNSVIWTGTVPLALPS